MASVNVTILQGEQIMKPPHLFSVILQSNGSDVVLGDKLANITILNKNGESINTPVLEGLIASRCMYCIINLCFSAYILCFLYNMCTCMSI